MPDREKVIEGLTEIYDEAYDRWVHRQYIEDKLITLIGDYIPNALALLREQDAIEPREQEETRTWIVCGNCSQHLISKWLWCPYCGRRVKWDGRQGEGYQGAVSAL